MVVPTAGVTIDITDNTGATHQARFFAVTPNQINCLIPADTALGPAILTVHNGNGATSKTEIEVVAVAPGLFSLAGTGEGVARLSIIGTVGHKHKISNTGTRACYNYCREDMN